MLSDAVQRCFWQRACGRCHGIGTHRSRDGSLADGLGVFEALLAAFGRCPLWCAFRTQVGHRVRSEKRQHATFARA